jgi:hypothetical protein
MPGLAVPYYTYAACRKTDAPTPACSIKTCKSFRAKNFFNNLDWAYYYAPGGVRFSLAHAFEFECEPPPNQSGVLIYRHGIRLKHSPQKRRVSVSGAGAYLYSIPAQASQVDTLFSMAAMASGENFLIPSLPCLPACLANLSS